MLAPLLVSPVCRAQFETDGVRPANSMPSEPIFASPLAEGPPRRCSGESGAPGTELDAHAAIEKQYNLVP